MQYQIGSSLVISGIPITVTHTELKGIVIKLVGAVSTEKHNNRDEIGVRYLCTKFHAGITISTIVVLTAPTKLFNAVCGNTISARDIIACHRISKSSPRVLVKFLNKKDDISLLGAKLTVNRLNNEDIGLGYCDKFV